MSRKRTFLLAALLVAAAFIIFTARKIFDYAAAPLSAKDSNFVFPQASDQEKPTVLISEPKAPPITFTQLGGFTNDASHLNKTAIYGLVHVSTEADVRSALQFARDHNLKISCAGQQHSMGGQTFTHGGLILDFRDFNRIQLDEQLKTVNVQSGVRWWQLQQLLDKHGLSVKSMQSINIFSIGGSLSINAHGIDPAPGQIAPTVQRLRVMLSDGSIVIASPTENADLFRHVLGGYGLFGVILDADLSVVDNELYDRRAVYLDYKDFPAYYRAHIEGNDQVGLAFGRISISPTSYLRETAIHIYTRTQLKDSLPPLTPPKMETFDRFVINFSKTGGVGRWFRWSLEKYLEPRLHTCISRNEAMNQKADCLVSRNQEMYDDMAYLKNRLHDTDILQEYFVPYDRMPEFVDALRETVQANKANLLNVTIRTVHKDNVTALPYAKQDMFAFVLYFNVKFNEHDNEVLKKTTSDLVDATERSGGTYYLPYQLFYSPEQLHKAYPEAGDFFASKRKYDPTVLFSNQFYEKYGM